MAPPPPLFAGPGVVATGLACDHPPNSSSCCTENPLALVDVFVGASPQPESNALVLTDGVGLNDATGDGAFVTGGAAVV